MKQNLKGKGKNLKLTASGFTLIELLAVIVILAVIALIATPLIMNTINDAKDSAMQRSVQNIQHAVEQHLMSKKVLDENYTFDINKFDYKGEKYDKMNIAFNEKDEAGVAVYKDNKCYYVLAGSSNVVIDKDLDEAGCLAKAGTISNIAVGKPVYLDPTDLTRECNSTNSVSTTETKTGCMRWYVMNAEKEDGTVDLILDHNTTATTPWLSEDDYDGTNIVPTTINNVLATDTQGWVVSYKIPTIDDIMNLVPLYKDLEDKSTWMDVYGAAIMEAYDAMDTNVLESNYSTTLDWYNAQNEYLKTNYSDIVLPGFMYDDILANECASDGSCNTHGYWTISQVPGSPGSAFDVDGVGYVSYDYVYSGGRVGFRPVISVSKSIIH